MATFARWNRSIIDAAGNVRNATITVYKESDGLLATIYSDRAGATPKSNPFTLSSADQGYAYFHAVGGAYKVVATYGSYTQTWRYEPVGTGAEFDAGSLSGVQAPTTTVPAAVQIAEATNNGSNKLSITIPAALAADRTVTWPDADVTFGTKGLALLATTTNAGAQTAMGVREVLTGSRTYYVRTDGSDSNTGLANTAGGAFLTIAKALSVVADTLDLAGNTVTIQLGDGTWTTAVSLSRRWVGGPPEAVTLQGNTSTPGNVTINTTSANAVSISGPGVGITLAYMDVKTTTSGYGVKVEDGAKVVFGAGMRFGACVNAQIFARKNAIVLFNSNYTINGGAAQHIYIDTNTALIAQSLTITISGTPAFYQFFYADAGAMAVYNGHTFSGSATGARYSVTLNAAIQTFGGGATYLPGNSAGSTATGGQYA